MIVTIGTAEDNVLRVTDDPLVSAHHARVWDDEDGQVWIEDLGSTNGTYLVQSRSMMGLRIYGPTSIGPGDTFRIGRTLVPWTER